MQTLSETRIFEFIAMRCGLNGQNVQYTYDRPSTDAQTIMEAYHRARRMLLEEHDWDFATKTTNLQYDITQGGFILPPDCLRALCINGCETGWRLEERKIILGESSCNCDCDPCECGSCCENLKIRYIFDQQDVSKFTEHFIHAVGRTAAALAGKALTGSFAFEDRERIVAQQMLGKARAFQNQQAGGIKVILPKSRGGGCSCLC